MDRSEILHCFVEIVSSLDWGAFRAWLLEIIASVFGISVLITLWERHYTTKRLRKYVSKYLESVEGEWQNQTDEFILMHRVRAFELLLRRVRGMRPTTPLANMRVDEVRDAAEFFHTDVITIFRGEHLPLPKMGEFPMEPNDEIESHVREYVLDKLRAIKWLGLEEPANR